MRDALQAELVAAMQRRDLDGEQQRAIVGHERADLLAHAERLRRLCRLDEADGALRAADALEAALSHEDFSSSLDKIR